MYKHTLSYYLVWTSLDDYQGHMNRIMITTVNKKQKKQMHREGKTITLGST